MEYWQELDEAGVLEDGRRDSPKGSAEGNRKTAKLSDYGRAGAPANSEERGDTKQEPSAEAAGEQDNGSRAEAIEADD